MLFYEIVLQTEAMAGLNPPFHQSFKGGYSILISVLVYRDLKLGYTGLSQKASILRSDANSLMDSPQHADS